MEKHNEDSLYSGYCEYLTSMPVSRSVVVSRILIILSAVALSLFMLAITLKTIPVVSFMLLVIIIFMSWFVFQFTKIEYEYIIATGTLELSKIYGSRIRKTLFEIKTAQITSIVPESTLTNLGIPQENIMYTCKKNLPENVCLVYEENTNTNKVLVINAPTKTIKCLKHYRKSAFKDF